MSVPIAPSRGAPHIVAVGLHRLKEALYELAPSYVERAEVSVLDRGFDEAIAGIRALEREQGVDALVAAGSNGEYLRRRLQLPVVLVRVGGYDIMRALAIARGVSTRIALVTHGPAPVEVEQFNERFGLAVELRSYQTEQQAREVVHELRALGIEVVVAPGLVTDLAEAAGLKGVFLYSQDAIRAALDDAVEAARRARTENARRERLSSILHHLRDGVVAVDMQGCIEAINPAMERTLGQATGSLLGRKLTHVAAELNLDDTLTAGRIEIDEVQRVAGRTVITSRMPIREHGVQTGAVLSCRDPASIQGVDRRLRAQRARTTVTKYRLHDLVGDCASIRRTREIAAQFAASDATVLIIGESGTGKEMLAQGIHSASRRSSQPFIAVNCAAFPESLLESELFGYEDGAFTGARRGGKIGLFEAGHTGTIFLDEIGEMPMSLQTRLLRVLQEREILRVGATEATRIDVRVIAATHRDLAASIEAQRFRRDLYYRLNILRIAVPSLRERRADLPMLAAHIFDRVCARLNCSKDPLGSLIEELTRGSQHYDWPGNVRELENLIERIASHCSNRRTDVTDLHELIPEIFSRLPEAEASTQLTKQKNQAEIELIGRVLAECGGDRTLASERLGISRTTLWRKLSRPPR